MTWACRFCSSFMLSMLSWASRRIFAVFLSVKTKTRMMTAAATTAIPQKMKFLREGQKISSRMTVVPVWGSYQDGTEVTKFLVNHSTNTPLHDIVHKIKPEIEHKQGHKNPLPPLSSTFYCSSIL